MNFAIDEITEIASGLAELLLTTVLVVGGYVRSPIRGIADRIDRGRFNWVVNGGHWLPFSVKND